MLLENCWCRGGSPINQQLRWSIFWHELWVYKHGRRLLCTRKRANTVLILNNHNYSLGVEENNPPKQPPLWREHGLLESLLHPILLLPECAPCTADYLSPNEHQPKKGAVFEDGGLVKTMLFFVRDLGNHIEAPIACEVCTLKAPLRQRKGLRELVSSCSTPCMVGKRLVSPPAQPPCSPKKAWCDRPTGSPVLQSSGCLAQLLPALAFLSRGGALRHFASHTPKPVVGVR